MSTTVEETLAGEAAVAGVWVSQYAAALEGLKESTAQTAQGLWVSFDGWYNAAAVAALAQQAADLSRSAQQVATGLSQQYLAQVTSLLLGDRRVEIPPTALQPIRNGVNLRLVHHRTAEAYKKAIATGSDHPEALARALQRVDGLVRSDIALRERDAQNELMRNLGVTTFRRIIHPELSETGACGLCVVAANRVYKTGFLMPIHPPHCKCTVMPIIDGKDPGLSLNRADLDRIYEVAGSSYAKDLLNTRVGVGEHGELGPVLHRGGDSFRGPNTVALEDDPARAKRMLDKTLPVLERLEAAGGPDGPLLYQRELVAKLRGIAGA